MSWNKYNIYNHKTATLDRYKLSDQMMRKQKIYAQRVYAKRWTRKYHGQGLPERIFRKQLFAPDFNAVAGGKDNQPRFLWGNFYRNVERRLDTIIFRSLFATSISQARQMVIHGHVEVNGKIVTSFSRFLMTGKSSRCITSAGGHLSYKSSHSQKKYFLRISPKTSQNCY